MQCLPEVTGNFLSKEVTTKLDRFKISNTAAMAVIGAVAQTSGEQCLNDVTLSTSSIRRYRNRNRTLEAAAIQIEFPENTFIQVHWDSKQMADIAMKHERVERLAITVTGGGKEDFLEGAKIENGTGICMAEAVFGSLQKASLQDCIRGFSFDTTASNTGLKSGACIKLQERLGRNILWLACRHHIHEVVLSDVFQILLRSIWRTEYSTVCSLSESVE